VPTPDDLVNLLGDVAVDAPQRYPFQLVQQIHIIIFRCKCRPNNVLVLGGIGKTVTCDHCGISYTIHQMVYNAADAAHAGEVGIALDVQRPTITRPKFIEPEA